MRQHNLIATPTFHDLAINASSERPCQEEILQRIRCMMDMVVTKHNKVFFVRMDIRFPVAYQGPVIDNRVFADFLENFMQFLERAGMDPLCLWVREQTEVTDHPHYHLCLFLDGNRIQNIHIPCAKARELWALALGLPSAEDLVWDCTEGSEGKPQKNGLMIRRTDENFREVFEQVFYWASYIAKANTKGLAPSRVKEYGGSRVPRCPLLSR